MKLQRKCYSTNFCEMFSKPCGKLHLTINHLKQFFFIKGGHGMSRTETKFQYMERLCCLKSFKSQFGNVNILNSLVDLRYHMIEKAFCTVILSFCALE